MSIKFTDRASIGAVKALADGTVSTMARAVRTGIQEYMGAELGLMGRKPVMSGFTNGIYASYSTGSCGLSEVDLTGVTNGVDRIGATAMEITLRGGLIDASSIGAYTKKSGVAAICNLIGVTIDADTHGALTGDGSRTEGCTIKSSNTTGQGVAVGNGSRAFNNQVNGFNQGIVYSYTTSAEVACNRVYGATTSYVSTGSTSPVVHNNY